MPRKGLRLIEERERVEQAKLKALKQAARQGWADVSAGRFADDAETMRRIQREAGAQFDRVWVGEVIE